MNFVFQTVQNTVPDNISLKVWYGDMHLQNQWKISCQQTSEILQNVYCKFLLQELNYRIFTFKDYEGFNS